MSDSHLFSGNIPQNYDKYLGPYLFEPYALDLSERLQNEHMTMVLELACGTGRVTRHLLEILNEKGQIVATDINNDMLQVAKTVVADSRVEWRVADAQELPFSNNTFDHVICQFGVMFFPDKLKAFKEAHRVLGNNGRFVFNTWGSLDDNVWTQIIKDVMTDLFKDEAPPFLQKGPYSFYDLDVIKDLLTTAGFGNINIETVRKAVEYEDVEMFIQGFLTGTPLSAFFQSREAAAIEVLRQRLREAIRREFGDTLKSEMLAFVCMGNKE